MIDPPNDTIEIQKKNTLLGVLSFFDDVHMNRSRTEKLIKFPIKMTPLRITAAV